MPGLCSQSQPCHLMAVTLDNESACDAEDLGSIPGLGRCPGERNSNPFQYSRLGNPMGRGAWQATVHGVAKSQTRPSDSLTDRIPLCLQFLLYNMRLTRAPILCYSFSPDTHGVVVRIKQVRTGRAGHRTVTW